MHHRKQFVNSGISCAVLDYSLHPNTFVFFTKFMVTYDRLILVFPICMISEVIHRKLKAEAYRVKAEI